MLSGPLIINIFIHENQIIFLPFHLLLSAYFLKENKNKLYTDLDQIKKEVDMAKNTFKKYKWPFIDVTRKSVEETAASVIKIYEIYKENA